MKGGRRMGTFKKCALLGFLLFFAFAEPAAATDNPSGTTLYDTTLMGGNSTNYGIIDNWSDYRDGIAGAGFTLVNASGAFIYTSGYNAYGIYATPWYAVAINAGLIETTGDTSTGILGFMNATLTNSGTIRTYGQGAQGLYGINQSNLTNMATGAIYTYGAFSSGMRAEVSSTAQNQGRIQT